MNFYKKRSIVCLSQKEVQKGAFPFPAYFFFQMQQQGPFLGLRLRRCEAFFSAMDRHSSSFRYVWLSTCWVAGLIAGSVSFIQNADPILPLMRISSFGDVSIVCFCRLLALPPLLSMLSMGIPALLYAIAFGRAFLFSYSSMVLLVSYGTAGWLVRLLVGFSGLFSCPILYRLWLRGLCTNRRLSVSEMLIFIFCFFLIGIIDYSMVAPLWRSMIL